MHPERQKTLMSTAGFYRNKDVARLFIPGQGKKDVLDRMVQAPEGNGFSPEIMLFSPMMTVDNLRHIRSKEEERIGKGDTIYWHFPKFHGWYWNKDFMPFVEQTTNIKRDPIGFLFYLPYLRNIVSPGSKEQYLEAIDNWVDVFHDANGDKSKNGQNVITVHDYTIFDRTDDGNLQINIIGKKLSELANQGFKVSVELATEGSTPPIGCPTPGHINSFLKVCHDNGFGLTLDTFNLWSIVGFSGGWIDDYFHFFGEVITEAEREKVPIHLVHFKPFDLSTSTQAVAPDESPFSYKLLRSFLDINGLSEVPISFEIKRKYLPDDIQTILDSTSNHEMMERFITG